jgi:hypothetical protein
MGYRKTEDGERSGKKTVKLVAAHPCTEALMWFYKCDTLS